MRGVVLDAVPLELAAAPARLLEEGRVAADREELLHLVVEELVVLARRPALEEECLAAELLDLRDARRWRGAFKAPSDEADARFWVDSDAGTHLVGVICRGRAPQRRRRRRGRLAADGAERRSRR